MLIFAGLGNPGAKHERQRHNVGFMAVDAIHDTGDFSPWKPRFQALASEGRIGSEKVLLLKPATYMNESGRAVGEALRFFKVDADAVTAFYDELDLTPGKVRLKTGGGAGGHNGIRSLDQHLPSKDYRRVRIGIGHPGAKEQVTSHVLGDFAKADHAWLDPLLDEMARNADMLVAGDDAGFMNRLALRTQSNEPPGAKGQASAKTKKQPPKQQSHIRGARNNASKPDVPKSGPMAEMLAKLLGKKD
jgi:PTH1 family peptidyl-tRNA hydrolase